MLHGFPTCSFDYAACLPALAARRRVVLPDHLGHGLSAKPDVRYGVRMLADAAEAAVVALGIDEVDLLTHDVGDSVGGELLARSLDGELGFSVRRRVVTNGSIYMDLVQLSDGQKLLLSLPDEPVDLITEELWTGGVRATFAPGSDVSDEELALQWACFASGDGQRMMPRTIRYIEDRQAEERRYTEPIEVHPSPFGVVWGRQDPIAVHAMAERLASRAPRHAAGDPRPRRPLPDGRRPRRASRTRCCRSSTATSPRADPDRCASDRQNPTGVRLTDESVGETHTGRCAVGGTIDGHHLAGHGQPVARPGSGRRGDAGAGRRPAAAGRRRPRRVHAARGRRGAAAAAARRAAHPPALRPHLRPQRRRDHPLGDGARPDAPADRRARPAPRPWSPAWRRCSPPTSATGSPTTTT